ncbi:MAG TPA: hypothetical protein ENH29_07725 [Bacteroidetes bacterium]|nr:hypothetical protein [Bacteroidota bacterium]
MEISIEKLVSLVTAEVVKELVKQGVKVTSPSGPVLNANETSSLNTKVQKINMSKYKTPVLTENHIRRLHVLTGAVVVPKGTIVTPKAKELIREKQIDVVVE